MLIALLVFIALSLLVLGHEGGHFVAAKLFGLKIEEFGFGFPPRIFVKRKDETEYSLNWLPFGGFVKIAGEDGGLEVAPEERGRYFRFQPSWKKFLIIAAGVFVNFLIGWFLLSLVLSVGTPRAVVVSAVQAGSPAEKAGLLPGDAVKNFSSAGDFVDFTNEHRGRSVNFEMIRGGRDLNFSITPRQETAPGEGAIGAVVADAGVPKEPLLRAVADGFRESLLICWFTLVAFYEVINDLLFHATLLPGVVGPVGIFSVAQGAGHLGFVYLLQLVSVISLNLAVVNLIPLPALDGGRIFLILIEKLKGSPLSRRTESLINSTGLSFLLLLIILITVRDIRNLF